MKRAQVQLAGQVLEEVLASMTEEERQAVRNVRLVCKAKPERRDLERGCTPKHQAAFWGVARELGGQARAELPELGAQVLLPDPRPARGEIVLFLDNLAPVTSARLAIALRHEYA